MMTPSGMAAKDVMRLVNRYIGVSGGYLGDFSYRTHEEFYAEYCDLEIDAWPIEGTTRERFIYILQHASPDEQAKIIRGTLERFAVGDSSAPGTRTQQLHDQFEALAGQLEGMGGYITGAVPKVTSEVVTRAINDAERLLQTEGATSGVDRLHTAMHGYLLAVARDAGISLDRHAPMTAIFKSLRKGHPALQDLGVRATEIERVLNSSANILDAMNPVRNNASVAHPNDDLLDEPEARLVINEARTLMTYLNDKL